MKRAAYFALQGNYFGRPLDHNIVQALLAADYHVDIHSPGEDQRQHLYPASVRRQRIEYRAPVLARAALPLQRRGYDLFIGTADLPMAVVGVLGTANRTPTLAIADEIFIGGYEGRAAS